MTDREPDSPESSFAFACPVCHAPLDAPAMDVRRCPGRGTFYRRKEGVWRFLSPDRAQYYRQFIEDYEAIRQAEGRGSDRAAHYRALPFIAPGGRFEREWKIRARSLETLVEQVLASMEAERSRPLQVVDLGAGNGWLSHRLAQRGHNLAAVDLLVNSFDGLGAHVYYDTDFVLLQADFDHLPLAGCQADLVIYSASLHYANDYGVTLREALRVLSEGGRLVVMDSPIYQNAASGEQMVQEREAHFAREYGFRSDALHSKGYLTHRRIDELARDLELTWQRIVPWYGWRWALRPWKARLLGRREPAAFLLLVGERKES